MLVYAEAADSPAKKQVALTLLKPHDLDTTGVLSTQVLQEQYNAAFQKLQLPIEHIRAQLDLYGQFEVIQITPAILRCGLDLHQTRSVAFYNAVMIASAHIVGCATLLSEDMNAGDAVNEVRIVNAFVVDQNQHRA